MIQGTASHVGKTVIVAALCRLFAQEGYRVAPFKAQNMANNSHATPDGYEIGRAQAVQAAACGIPPAVEMNPILLKPATDKGAQVVVLGKPVGVMSAVQFQKYKKKLVPVVEESLRRLMEAFDLVIMEGAGNPAEMNLKKHDLVNMRVAKMASSPVVLVGDIDRGGVFAQLVGTYELLDKIEKKLVSGFLVNKFRGDKRILLPGLSWLKKRTKKRVLGVIPYVQGLTLSEEDSVALEGKPRLALWKNNQLVIHVVRLPRISNFTDFDPLTREKDVNLQYIEKPDRHILPDVLIIPGTKSTMRDLKFLWSSGFASYIKHCVKAGRVVMGICGGYQMIGERILDPSRVESDKTSCEGLGLLPLITVFHRTKTTAQVRAVHCESGLEIQGYEIHMGCTQERKNGKPLFKIVKRHGMAIEDYDGFVLDGGKNAPFICGTYIHGVFDNGPFRRYFLNRVRARFGLKPFDAEGNGKCNSSLDAFDTLARVVRNHVDMKFLQRLVEK